MVFGSNTYRTRVARHRGQQHKEVCAWSTHHHDQSSTRYMGAIEGSSPMGCQLGGEAAIVAIVTVGRHSPRDWHINES